MPWLTDLAPIFGGGVTIAGAMYGACAAAEKAARPEALKDIGHFLKDPSWSWSVRPSAVVEKVFRGTFGERHFSWKCARRSATATIIFVAAICLALYVVKGFFIYKYVLSNVRETAFDAGVVFLGDYIALGKTRLLLRGWPVRLPITVIVAADVVLSLAISSMVFMIFYPLYIYWAHYEGAPVHIAAQALKYSLSWFFALDSGNISWFTPVVSSTVLTSIWTILILLSTTVLKLVAPVHQFTAWFFDVEKHPVQAIGIVAGALVMIGSLIWSVLRVIV